jgi:hypothetical protein
MNKEIRNRIETELIAAYQEVLKKYSPEGALKVRKNLKESSRKLTKKFHKVVKDLEKKEGAKKPFVQSKQSGKSATKGPGRPATKRPGRPATKRKVSKTAAKATPAKKTTRKRK